MKNYKEVKNYIHNDLKISKEDIHNLIISTVKNEVSKLLKDESFVSSMMKNHILSLLKEDEYKNPNYKTITDINKFIYDNVLQELCRTVHSNIKIKIELNEDLDIKTTKDEIIQDKKFAIHFYNRFACQNQIHYVYAKNIFIARHKFWETYPRKDYHDCIESIRECNEIL